MRVGGKTIVFILEQAVKQLEPIDVNAGGKIISFNAWQFEKIFETKVVIFEHWVKDTHSRIVHGLNESCEIEEVFSGIITYFLAGGQRISSVLSFE